MTDFTSAPKVLPTTPGNATTGRIGMGSVTSGAAAPSVDRNAIWRFLKDSATRLLNNHNGKDSQGTAIQPQPGSLSPATKETLVKSPINQTLETSSQVLAGSEVRLLMRIYLALKTIEDHLRQQAVEGRSRFGRWVAGVGASAIGFITSVFTPSQGVEQRTVAATHVKLKRRIASKDGPDAESRSERPIEAEVIGRKGTSEQPSTAGEQETTTEIMHRGSLELDEARRKEKQEKQKGSLAQDQEKDALAAIQEQQLIALALIDGMAGPEVFAILNGLRQPYASVGAARDGIELTNQADQRTLRRRFEQFFGELKLTPV